jgi:RNA polymerase sigma-70 factor (ECF subfamily)
MRPASVEQSVQAAFKDEWGRIVATLIRRTGDWDLAEECAQEAFAEALRRWPKQGIPDRPGAWLTTVAGNRAIDRLRRAARGAELVQRAAQDELRTRPMAEDPTSAMFSDTDSPDFGDGHAGDGHPIDDDRLRLIFTCCHPALSLEARVALTLRTLTGLSVAEVARAFLVPEATMAKRLVRAKAKIAAARIPYRVPPAHLLPERTSGVLAVLYLLFNEGYSASSGDTLIRAGLCDEAIRLARLLHQLMPREPEAAALLALMLLQDSRRPARLDADGELITLEHQDRGAWNHAEIAEAGALLAAGGRLATSRTATFGPYRLQAEIAACHASAATVEETDWTQIAALYGALIELTPSPVVSLNRAVAVAMAGDLDQGLALVDELNDEPTLRGYHLLAATRADLLRRRGDTRAAAAEYEHALGLAPSESERRYLRRRIAELGL